MNISPYINLMIQPLKEWESIPWMFFGYAFTSVLGSILIFPLVCVGLLLTEFVEQRTGHSVYDKYSVAGQYSGLFILLFGVPLLVVSLSLFFFIMGYYIDGYLLVVGSLIWILGYSEIMPGLYYLIGEYSVKGWTHILQISKFIAEDSQTYHQYVKEMALVNIIFFGICVLLIASVVGILLIPLVLLWYTFICGEIYSKVEESFGNIN